MEAAAHGHHDHEPMPTSGRALDERCLQRHAALPDGLCDRRDHRHGDRHRARVLQPRHDHSGHRARLPLRIHADQPAAVEGGAGAERGDSRLRLPRTSLSIARRWRSWTTRISARGAGRDGGGNRLAAVLGQPVRRPRDRGSGRPARQPMADRARQGPCRRALDGDSRRTSDARGRRRRQPWRRSSGPSS